MFYKTERTVSNVLVATILSGMVLVNFYLWGHLKSKVRESNPHNLHELRKNFLSFTETAVLCKVFLNMLTS
jgi:predicted secreted protein